MRLYKDKRDEMLDDLYQFVFDYGSPTPVLLTFQDLCIFMRQKRGAREPELRSMIDGDRRDAFGLPADYEAFVPLARSA